MKLLKINKYTQRSYSIFACVDDWNYERLNKFNWSSNDSCNRSKSVFRTTARPKRIRISLANEILGISGIVDHIDRNPLNNLESNLRCCTYSQNMMNRTKFKHSSSSLKGVHWDINKKKWRARIRKNKKLYHLGFFEKEITAGLVYNVAAKQLHGEFLHVNSLDMLLATCAKPL